MIHKCRLYIFFIVTVFFCSVQPAQSMDCYWEKHSDHERIVFELRDELAGFVVKRTGREELSFDLPEDVWASESTLSPEDFSGSRLISDIRFQDKNFVIRTSTDAFGYIYYTLPHENKGVIVMFMDYLGARWEPDPDKPSPSLPAPLIDAPQPEPLMGIEPRVMEPYPAHKIRATIQRAGPEVRGQQSEGRGQ